MQPLTDEETARLLGLQTASISSSDQSKVLQAISNSLGGNDRARLVLQFSKAAIEQIELKKKSLMDPVDELERQTLTELARSYTQIQEAQSTVTAHLSSITKVTEEQDKVLKQLGLFETRDVIIEKAIDANRKVVDILGPNADPDKILTDLEESSQEPKEGLALIP